MPKVVRSLKRDSHNLQMPVDRRCAQALGLQIISPFTNVTWRNVLNLFVGSCPEIVEKPGDDHFVRTKRARIDICFNVLQPIVDVPSTSLECHLASSRAAI